jgi:hypothetical protein
MRTCLFPELGLPRDRIKGPDYTHLTATPELQGRVTGPYGTCMVTDEGSTDRGGAPFDFVGKIRAGKGGIPYAWQDDCFSNTDGQPDGDFGSGDADIIVLLGCPSVAPPSRPTRQEGHRHRRQLIGGAGCEPMRA